MTTYEPATPHSDSIIRPACSKCGAAMQLFGIEATIEATDDPAFDLYSFECPNCQHIDTRLGNAA
jgi:hypothetical protein